MKWSKMEGDYATDRSLWIHSIAVAIVLIGAFIYVHSLGSPYGVLESRTLVVVLGAAVTIWLSELIGRTSARGGWRSFDMTSPPWDGPSAGTIRWLAWIVLSGHLLMNFLTGLAG